MKVRKLYSLLFVMTVICFGCQDQELTQSEESTDVITFALYGNGEVDQSFTPLTRTVEKPLVLINEDGTDSLTFYLTITDTIDLEQRFHRTDTIISRGTPITQENLVSMCSGKIALDAFYQNNPFFKDVIIFNNNGGASTSITRYWPNNKGTKVAFWSYYPEEIAESTNFTISTDEANPSLSFYYNQHDTDGKLIDVKYQKDLFFDYAYNGKENGVVPFRYRHAVSAIKFVAGKTLAGTIKNINLTNVYAGGTLTYTPNETPEFKWELDETPSTLDQDFEVEIDENLKGDPLQAITSDEAGTTFLLIPQTVGGKKLSITIDRAGTVVTYSAFMPDGNWEMGKTYTYTLELMDGLGIDASGDVVNGVEISNTNKKICYVRAMILGNWVDMDGNVAAIFNPEDVDLKITSANKNYACATNWGDYWHYDTTNNLYYYMEPLPEGQSTTVKLFEKFTIPKRRMNEGLKLDFVVLVQAVEASKTSVIEAWGADIADRLETLN